MSDFLKDILEAINEISSEVNQSKNMQGNNMDRNPYPRNLSSQPKPPGPSYYNRPLRSEPKPGYGTTPRPQVNYGVGRTNIPNPSFEGVPGHEGNFGFEGSSGFEGTPGYEGNSLPQTYSDVVLEDSPGVEGSPGTEGSSGFEGSPGSEGREAVNKPVSAKKGKVTARLNENSIFETALDFSKLTEGDVIRGIVFSEVLGKPKALRRGRW
ncbi:MAG TPA: hypothetical protein PLA01_07740 [Acetivibrio sp.]|nr:hypothetical protein [Acetivibrio sp.]